MKKIAKASFWLVVLGTLFIAPLAIYNACLVWSGQSETIPYINYPLAFEVSSSTSYLEALLYWMLAGVAAFYITMAPSFVGIVWLAVCARKGWITRRLKKGIQG